MYDIVFFILVSFCSLWNVYTVGTGFYM